MNLKLNNEQIAYVNGLEDPEAKKDFLINCFLTQCEEEIKKEESKQEFIGNNRPQNHVIEAMVGNIRKHIEKDNLLKFDLPKAETETVVFKDGVFETNNPDTIKAMNNIGFSHLLKLEELVSRENFDFTKEKKFEESDIRKPIKLIWRPLESLSKEQLKDITKPAVELNQWESYIEMMELKLKNILYDIKNVTGRDVSIKLHDNMIKIKLGDTENNRPKNT